MLSPGTWPPGCFGEAVYILGPDCRRLGAGLRHPAGRPAVEDVPLRLAALLVLAWLALVGGCVAVILAACWLAAG